MLNRHRIPAFLLTTLSAALLSGCLSGSGSSSKANTEEPSDPLVINTTEGELHGIMIDDQRVFRAIPYAAAPVGERRFAPTAPPPQHSEPLKLSSEFGAACPQANLLSGQPSGSEDCLFLNVYAPAEAEGLPVMVWLHGGAFIFGNGGGEYDPTRLVNKDVIVVTLNYRLGTLGFLAHPSLDSDAGNFALMDQQQALRWVKQNIQAFGGDPNNVTLFGESAGGHSVMSHIVSPRAAEESLFKRAIVQSGSYAPFQISKPVAQFLGSQMASTLNCTEPDSVAECLRSLSVEQILAAQDGQSVPVVDSEDDLLPHSIQDALSSGEFNTDLDIMIGSNLDEGTLFVSLDELSNGSLDNLGETTYRSRVEDFFQPYQALIPFDTEQISSDYMDRYTEHPQRFSMALSAIWTDFMFACNSYLHASQFTANDLNTFQYWFRDQNAPWTLLPSNMLSFPQGASHASEIPYVLYPEQLMRDRYNGTQEEVDKLSEMMVDYWAQFAKNGDPNTSDGVAPQWPEHSSGNLLMLDAPQVSSTSALTFLGQHNCAYWANPPLRVPSL